MPTVYENKEVQVPSEDEEEYIELDESATEVIEAGQEGWQYTKMDCPEELLVSVNFKFLLTKLDLLNFNDGLPDKFHH